MTAPRLATEGDVLRTLRTGTYTLPELYALCRGEGGGRSRRRV